MMPFDPNRRIGTVTQVSPDAVYANLDPVTQRTGRLLLGGPLHGGQVGDFVVFDCDNYAVLGRILEVKLPERERMDIERHLGHTPDPHPLARMHLLGALQSGTERVIGGIPSYPTLGASVFAASPTLVTHFASSFGQHDEPALQMATLNLGSVRDAAGTVVKINADHIFARHCAILGATGGGKSTTVARILDQCLRDELFPKIILIDPTGEYGPIAKNHKSLFLGTSKPPTGEVAVRIPCEHLQDGDYMSILAPSPAQRVKLIEAIQSLRLVEVLKKPEFADDLGLLTGFITGTGLITKFGKRRADYYDVRTKAQIAKLVEDPRTPFEFSSLSSQIMNECVEESSDIWKVQPYLLAQGWCQSLLSKINMLRVSAAWTPIFGTTEPKSIFSELDAFFRDSNTLLRINLNDLSFDFHLREIAVNLIGRWLRERVRNYELTHDRPVLVVLDEAHHFLNQHLGEEDFRQPLDAFEKIAKEGRKFWLNLVLATQQPRDIPPGILSQMGTLIVHRLINDADRRVVEAACGELDTAAAKFLPSLRPGEAVIIGVEFPIPLTIQIEQPPKDQRPSSAGPKYSSWLQQKAPK
ncbi:MAG: ATP-binding protein [Planctomycetes bacterium]|nr:ATP-binding protein [Planctomycetota bacterium]